MLAPRFLVVTILGLLAAASAHAEEPLPSDVMAELTERALATDGAPEAARLAWRVRSDGSYDGENRKGKLSARALDTLRAELARTKLVARPVHPCDAISTSALTLRTQRGKLAWSTPCGEAVDPSVDRLLRLVRDLLAPKAR